MGEAAVILSAAWRNTPRARHFGYQPKVRPAVGFRSRPWPVRHSFDPNPFRLVEPAARSESERGPPQGRHAWYGAL